MQTGHVSCTFLLKTVTTTVMKSGKFGALSGILPHAMLITAAVFWGLNPILMKIGLAEIDPLPFNTLRLFWGIIIMFPVLLASGSWKPVPFSHFVRLFALPVAGFFLFQVLFSFGVAATSASVASVILGTLPIMVALITLIFRTEKVTVFKLAGIAATFMGVIILSAGGKGGLSSGGTYLAGVVFLAASEFFYGIYTVFIRPVIREYSIFQVVFIGMTMALILFAAFSFPRYGVSLYFHASPAVYGSSLFSGIFALVLGNTLWSAGVKRIGGIRASVYGNLPPVCGVAGGFVLLGERLTAVQLAGAAVILTGIILVNRRRNPVKEI